MTDMDRLEALLGPIEPAPLLVVDLTALPFRRVREAGGLAVVPEDIVPFRLFIMWPEEPDEEKTP